MQLNFRYVLLMDTQLMVKVYNKECTKSAHYFKKWPNGGGMKVE